MVSVVSLSLFIKLFGNIVGEVADKIDGYVEEKQTREKNFENIAEELFKNNLISNNLKFISYKYGWNNNFADKTDKYYFYIDGNDYDEYKHYWLEGIDESQYTYGYNAELLENGDYVFKVVNIKEETYASDIEHYNVQLKANKTYYFVNIYEEGLYFKRVSGQEANGDFKYNIDGVFKYKEESISNMYVFYQENGNWNFEKLII